VCLEKKPLSFFSKFIFSSLKHPPQKHDKIRKTGNLKYGAQRWLRFSQSLIHVQTLRDIIFLHPVSKKTLSQFFKIPSGFPEIVLGRQVIK
jgi:hypothetical protein